MNNKYPDDIVELTQTMVRIPSENPTGDETALAEYVTGWLHEYGIATDHQPVEGSRKNVFGRLKGQGESRPLVYMAHMDTVPVGEKARWSYDPFGGEIVGDKMYGRGTCDMKGGLAAAMLTLKKIKEAGVKLAGDLVLACTVDEESTMKGTHAMSAADKAFWADAYLLAMEPTSLKLNTAQKGALWFQVVMRGQGAHAANPQFGRDANRAMARAILGWYDLVDVTFKKELPEHPLLGYPSLIVSKLNGGVKTNIVSEYCHGEIDMRVPPTVSVEVIIERLQEIGEKAAATCGASFELLVPQIMRLPVECTADSPLLSAFDKAWESVTREKPVHEGFLAYTDAAMLAVLTGNKHATVFGPGALSDAHTTNESVEIGQLFTAEAVLERTALELLAG